MNSALPRMVQPVSSDARRSRISGVLPMAAARPAATGGAMGARSMVFLPEGAAALATAQAMTFDAQYSLQEPDRG